MEHIGNGMDIIELRYITKFGDETVIKRAIEDDAVLEDQINAFLDLLRGAGYNADTIEEMDEALSDAIYDE